jgi:hypothetical protein
MGVIRARGSTQDMLIGCCEHTDEPALVTRNHPTTKLYINTIFHAPCMFQHCFAIYRDVQLSGCHYKVNNVTHNFMAHADTHFKSIVTKSSSSLLTYVFFLYAVSCKR